MQAILIDPAPSGMLIPFRDLAPSDTKKKFLSFPGLILEPDTRALSNSLTQGIYDKCWDKFCLYLLHYEVYSVVDR